LLFFIIIIKMYTLEKRKGENKFKMWQTFKERSFKTK